MLDQPPSQSGRARELLFALLEVERIDELADELEIAGCLLLLAHNLQSYLTGYVTVYNI